jgi:serine protease Do
VVTLADGRRLKAQTLGMNHRVDSGMLKITESGTWDYLEMGESDPMRLGQWVMAVGHPGGYQEPRGMVIRIGRLLAMTSSVLKSDCTLVGGDSGGPLVDMDGRVVGIHSRIGANLNDNLHVPIDHYLTEWDRLESKEELGGMRATPWLGFSLKDGSLEVTEVVADGPAAKGGMQVGDVIRAFAGKEIESREQLTISFFQVGIGDEITVGVERGGQRVELKMVAERRR